MNVSISPGRVMVNGPLGELAQQVPARMKIEQAEGTITGARPSEIVVKERISLNMMVSSFDSPPALKYFLGSCSISRMTPGET